MLQCRYNNKPIYLNTRLYKGMNTDNQVHIQIINITEVVCLMMVRNLQIIPYLTEMSIECPQVTVSQLITTSHHLWVCGTTCVRVMCVTTPHIKISNYYS